MDRRTKATLNRDKAVRLNETWDVGAAQARYSDDGHWYATLSRFPAALFDANGYVLFQTEQEYRSSPYLNVGKQISVPKPGISAIPGYVLVADSEANQSEGKQMDDVPKRILEVAERLKGGDPPKSYKVRAVLKWFGAERRGAKILADIKAALANLDLQTQPNIDEVGIDEPVKFFLAASNSADSTIKTLSVNKPSHQPHTNAMAEILDLTPNPDAPSDAPSPPSPSDDYLEDESEDAEQPITKPDDRPVISQSSDWTISALRDKLDRGLLHLQPKFQREYVWVLRPELPSRLIESLLLEIPIPPIYFGKNSDGSLEMIDGQQRLTTLVNFVSNKFPLRKLNRMASLNHKLFKDLTQQHQEKILDTPIRSIVIDAAKNTGLRYEVFERLNRGSMALNEQELRNCVYRGAFNDLLAELEKDTHWRKIKGGNFPEPRFKEREIILRFFAFVNRLPSYTGRLKSFLNEYMEQYHPQEGDATLKGDAASFRQTMHNIYAVFGSNSARLYETNARTNNGAWDSKFSVAAFDIQASALVNQPTAKVQKAAEQIRELFLFLLLTDTGIQGAISKATGSVVQTKIRWTKFRDLVDSIMNDTTIEPRFFDFEFRKKLFEKSAVCQLCGNEIHSLDDSTVDHIHPWSKGGKTIPSNGQLAHRGCNAGKNATTPETETIMSSLDII
jgi:hypothetical protein